MSTPTPEYTGPQYNADNVLVGPAAMCLKPFVKGATAASMLPDADKPLWEPWGGLWTPIGMTDEGVSFAFTRNTEDINGEEQAVPVMVTTTSIEWNVNTVLIEDTLDTMMYAFGGGTVTTVAATASSGAYEDLKVSEEMVTLAVGLEGRNEYGYARRIVIPKVVSVADVEVNQRRAEEAHKYETSFRSLCNTKDVVIRNYTSLPTGA